MKLNSTAWLLAALMCGVSVLGVAARPSANLSDPIMLETDVPRGFGEWREVRDQSASVVNPQLEKAVNDQYDQVLTRAYVNKDGYRIMLSVAYGKDQRGGGQAHRPEVCYPGVGFEIAKIEDGVLLTSLGNVNVRRLIASLGPRHEPVTYWLTVGDKVVNAQSARRFAEIALVLKGRMPDGLLFRISSIDNDSAQAFAMQRKFTSDMMESVTPGIRRKLSGLTPVATT
jgi:EpsI family protein